MNTRKINYQMIAVTTGLILLGGTISGSAPMVFADHSDDLKDKLAKLKELIAKWKENKKCPDRFKYTVIVDSLEVIKCDRKKPKVDIESPEKREKVTGPSVMISGTASDTDSGLDKVLVKVDRGSYEEVDEFDPETGDWKITKELDDGRHFVFAKVFDNVGNKKRDFTHFKVV